MSQTLFTMPTAEPAVGTGPAAEAPAAEAPVAGVPAAEAPVAEASAPSVPAAGTVGTTAREAWPLGPAPESYVLANVRAVLPDRVTDSASVVVEHGLIVDVLEGGAAVAGDIDGRGMLLAPGLIDVHSDALEKERAPRPSAELPLDFALASFESKIVAAGITTMFHGTGFHAKLSDGFQRTPEKSLDVCLTIDRYTSARVDHRVLHRFNLRGEGREALEERLAHLPEGHAPILLSHEDHTPGQGQYADVDHYIDSLVKGGEKREDVEEKVRQMLARARETEALREENLAWMGALVAAGKARLLGHDPDDAQAIDSLVARGGAIAEFPTTWEAARRAHEVGLPTVAGAPNVLRGGSHAGNVGAAELIREGLVDALASDYLPTGLLGAVAALVRQRIVDLPMALGLVTEGPARVADLTDRGRIAPGLRADLVLIDWSGTWPHVAATLRSGQQEGQE
jgi:alpha-D-ribose 1-methylphosphonate 5-triphosphate diphosphatase